jgi:hypothetical protein
MAAFILIDKDTVRSTCATKAEVLKFLLWVSQQAAGEEAQHCSSLLRAGESCKWLTPPWTAS